MAKEQLTGTLEEQCEFLYGMALEKMGQGNYTGAAHALHEIVKHNPGYGDAAQLLAQVRKRKSEQRTLILTSFAGAILFVGLGTSVGLANDLWFVGMACLGLLLGYGAGTLFLSDRQT